MDNIYTVKYMGHNRSLKDGYNNGLKSVYPSYNNGLKGASSSYNNGLKGVSPCYNNGLKGVNPCHIMYGAGSQYRSWIMGKHDWFCQSTLLYYISL